MRPRRCLTPLVAVVVLGLVCPPTWAVDAGVTVDNAGPAGKEYAVPLDAARRIGAAPAPTSRATGDPVAIALFGAGLSRGSGTGRRQTAHGVARHDRRTGDRAADAFGTARTATLRAVSSPAASGAPMSGRASMALIAAAVLVVGIGGGRLAAARRRRAA
jgi:hypothetical protein